MEVIKRGRTPVFPHRQRRGDKVVCSLSACMDLIFHFLDLTVSCCRQVRGSGRLPFAAINVTRKVIPGDRVTEPGG